MIEVTQVSKSKNELEITVHGANETLLGPLLNRTLADPQVDYASYYMGHILLDDPRFYVRTKKGTPKAAIDRAMESIIADIAAIQKKLAKEA
jgi:DNA-directed RNA polymerase subunit L